MAMLLGYRRVVLLIVLWIVLRIVLWIVLRIEQLRLVCLDGQYNAYLRVI